MNAGRDPSPPTSALTAAVPTGWRARIDPRPGLQRVRESTIPILQIVVAATGAYMFALYVLGHPAPLLAATVTVSSLGLVRDARPRRVVETVIGMLVGILVAELLLLVAGAGWWQLALALAATLAVARFLSAQPGFAIAAAIQSLIVMVIPAGAPWNRLIDGIVGGIAALLVTALIPRNPRRAEVHDGGALFAAVESTGVTLVQALRRGDRLRAERGLEKARALQTLVDGWRASLESGRAIARISPFLRRQRFDLDRHERIRQAMDLATRNLRVIARRVVYLCDDGAARPVSAEVLAELIRASDLIRRSLDDISLERLRKEFGDNVAVADVSLRDQGAAKCSASGPNGAGKTTSLKLLLGHYRAVGGRRLGARRAARQARGPRARSLPAEHFRFHDCLTGRELLRFHGTAVRLARRRARGAHRSPARPSRPHGRGRSPAQDLQQRHGAACGARAGARQRADIVLSRRADLRARSARVPSICAASRSAVPR